MLINLHACVAFFFNVLANPIIGEKFAKQLLRSKRQDRPVKAGHPDEPMREHLLRMQALDQRAQETNMEYWLNPHCPPRCDRNYGYPV
uniref:Si:dkey-31g6.6 n=1 Tax=Xiphophorus couchianus TaxID=32473 RepID=A0A3B5LWQ2_9TELE